MFWQFCLVLRLDLIWGELRFVGTRKGDGLARVPERRSVEAFSVLFFTLLSLTYQLYAFHRFEFVPNNVPLIELFGVYYGGGGVITL